MTIEVDAEHAKTLTYGARAQWLGKLAEEKLAEVLPPREPLSPGRNRWQPYTRERIAQAFREWAATHDGKAPVQRDWSKERDPEGIWPRSAGIKQAVGKFAAKDEISISTTAPCKDSKREQARYWWHEAKALSESAALLEHEADGESRVVYKPPPAPYGPDPGDYCADCFHGSGCRAPEMSPWQYAVEVISGLTVRNGGDFHATPSRRDEFGRNRQMVTAGAFAAPDVVHLEPTDERYIR
ncbi:MAG: hypothetical protein JSS97_00925 [Actinobacteria bacterium]|nr:hypothetical protein [Actinomycetota bacterium]